MSVIDILNIQPHVVSRDLTGYIIELYGRPKSGKTTTASKFPNSLLLGFERGWNALPGVMAQPVNSWTEFCTITNQLKKDEAKSMFKNIIIDTADIAYDRVEEFICQKFNLTSIGEEGTWGKYYKEASKEFDTRMRSIISMGYGLIFISHATDQVIKDKKGNEIGFRSDPTVNKRGANVINRMCDLICYIKPIIEEDPTTGKSTSTVYAFMRETPEYMAGSRFKYLTEYIPLSYDNLVNAIHNAIDKEATENQGQYVTDNRGVNLYADTSSKRDFSEVMEEVNNTINKIVEKGIDPKEITKIVEEVLGKDARVGECSPDQQELVELVIHNLQELLG